MAINGINELQSYQKSKWLPHIQTKIQLMNSSEIFWSAQRVWKPSNQCLFINVQGPPTHIDVFQTNIFSWFNDTLIQNQWFLGLWDREIWYKTFSFSLHQPHMASTTSERKDIKFLKKCGRGALMGMPRPCPLGSSSWVLGLSYDVYIFFCTSIGSVRNWSKAGGYIVFVFTFIL